LRVEILRHQFRDRFGTGRRHLRGLDDRGIAPGDRRNERRQRQHDRIIPGADDEPDAERIEAYLGAPGRHDQRRADVQGMHPAPQVVARIGRFVGDVFHVGRISIDAVAAQILPQRRAEVVGALGHQSMEGIELSLAPFDGTSLA
jgi:hypothetical protein